MQQKHDNRLPGWITFTASLIMIFGIIYGIYQSVFLNVSTPLKYKQEANLYLISAKQDMIIPQRTVQAIEAGQKLYSQVCSACHGVDLKGGVGPNLIDNEWRNPPAKESHLFKLIWNGIPNGKPPMPAKGGRTDLNSEQIWQIVYYISSLNLNIEKDSKPNQ